MAYAIEGGVILSVMIGDDGNSGLEIPLDAANLVTLELIQNANLLLPVVHMIFYDENNIQEKTGGFADGTPLLVSISNGEFDLARQSRFRIYSLPRQQPTNQGVLIELWAYLDAPDFMRKRVRQSYKGPSSQVVKEIAEECNMHAEVSETNDEQVWLPNGKSLGHFARGMQTHGWINAKSCMQFAVTELGSAAGSGLSNWTIRFLDLTQQAMRTPQAGFFNYLNGNDQLPGAISMGAMLSSITGIASNIGGLAGLGNLGSTVTGLIQQLGFGGLGMNSILYPILDSHQRNNSGFLNAMYGYGRRVVNQKLDGVDQFLEQLPVAKIAPFMEINSAVKKLLDGSVIKEAFTLDCGNFHENYAQASWQNRMQRGLYAIDMDVLTPCYTGMKLLDPTRLRMLSGTTGEVDETRSGNYIVSAKTQVVRGPRYVEKLQLVTQGPSTDKGGFRM